MLRKKFVFSQKKILKTEFLVFDENLLFVKKQQNFDFTVTKKLPSGFFYIGYIFIFVSR